MAQIGTFKSTGAGYSGHIKTLTLAVDVTLEPLRSRSEKSPDFGVFSGSNEIGIGFKRVSEKGNEYISVLIDDPSFARGIWCNLLIGSAKNGELPLMWERPRQKA